MLYAFFWTSCIVHSKPIISRETNKASASGNNSCRCCTAFSSFVRYGLQVTKFRICIHQSVLQGVKSYVHIVLFVQCQRHCILCLFLPRCSIKMNYGMNYRMHYMCTNHILSKNTVKSSCIIIMMDLKKIIYWLTQAL